MLLLAVITSRRRRGGDSRDRNGDNPAKSTNSKGYNKTPMVCSPAFLPSRLQNFQIQIGHIKGFKRNNYRRLEHSLQSLLWSSAPSGAENISSSS
jgi:hypothetical protein